MKIIPLKTKNSWTSIETFLLTMPAGKKANAKSIEALAEKTTIEKRMEGETPNVPKNKRDNKQASFITTPNS